MPFLGALERLTYANFMLAAILLAAGCADREEDGESQDSPVRPATPVMIESWRAVLRDDTATVLAKPVLASSNSRGDMIVADRSDSDIKIYDSKGARIGRVGRVGKGPGEFTNLMMAQAVQVR